MQSYQARVLQSHRRALHWCEANPDVVPPPAGPRESWPNVTRNCDDFRILIDAVEEAATQQSLQTMLASPEGTGEPMLREALCAEMRETTRIAQTLKTTVPGIGNLKMPADRIENEALVQFATGLVARATTFEAELTHHGITPGFPAMRAAITALRNSIDNRGIAKAKRVGATNDVALSLALGRNQLLRLDVAVTRILGTDLPRLAARNNARRVTMRGVTGPRTRDD
jgi:hypothetical protein